MDDRTKRYNRRLPSIMGKRVFYNSRLLDFSGSRAYVWLNGNSPMRAVCRAHSEEAGAWADFPVFLGGLSPGFNKNSGRSLFS